MSFKHTFFETAGSIDYTSLTTSFQTVLPLTDDAHEIFLFNSTDGIVEVELPQIISIQTPPNVAAFSATDNGMIGGGFGAGQVILYKAYAYVTIAGVTCFSPNPFVVQVIIGGTGHSATIVITIPAGATGVRVVRTTQGTTLGFDFTIDGSYNDDNFDNEPPNIAWSASMSASLPNFKSNVLSSVTAFRMPASSAIVYDGRTNQKTIPKGDIKIKYSGSAPTSGEFSAGAVR